MFLIKVITACFKHNIMRRSIIMHPGSSFATTKYDFFIVNSHLTTVNNNNNNLPHITDNTCKQKR